MAYLNDRTYARGEEVELKIAVDARKVKTARGVVYEKMYALFRSRSGYKIELWGEAPEVTGDKATIILTEKVEGVGDGDYRIEGGVQGRVPGDTVRFEPVTWLDKPLSVKGSVGFD
jgi:hypothetical protein